MDTQKKGCVYFFRHLGLSPVKIGFSSNNTPLKRFNAFKTYAPFGAELLGWIETTMAEKLESILHTKFSDKRLDGEWFDVSLNEIEYVIDHYTDKMQLIERSNFYEAYMMHKEKQQIDPNADIDDFVDKKKIFFKKYKMNNRISKKVYAEMFQVSRQTIHKWINDFKNK